MNCKGQHGIMCTCMENAIKPTLAASHTPTPWNHRPKDLQSPVRYITVEDNGFDRIIAHVLPTEKEDSFANAAFIVKACNAHEELIRLLKELRPILWNDGPLPKVYKHLDEQIDQALAKAEEGV